MSTNPGASTDDACSDDLRSFLEFVRQKLPREYLHIDDPLSGDWQLAAVTSALLKKMRMPVITFADVHGTQMPVIHNVCASLNRIAKSCGCTVVELEERLSAAYDHQIPPLVVADGPVRQNVVAAGDVDLSVLPAIRYTQSETNPYLSAAHVVAKDPQSGALNVSFHRMMVSGKNTLAIYMTPNGHLDRIFRHNSEQQRDTALAVFIGAHPLWSLGALAAGPLALDELHVIGGLLGTALPVVTGLDDEKLLIPARAEMVLEGKLSCRTTEAEGPYGEAFGYVSGIEERPVFTVSSISHRDDPLFQDIVPSQLEHLTMTGVAVQVHLRKALLEQFACVDSIFLPTPMTVYVAVSEKIREHAAIEILESILTQQRFVKNAVLFDHTVDISNAKQTQNAIAMHVQAHRDLVVVEDQPGNGLDPSEIGSKTTKWGIDASSYAKHNSAPVKNQLPEEVVAALDINGLLERAAARNG